MPYGRDDEFDIWKQNARPHGDRNPAPRTKRGAWFAIGVIIFGLCCDTVGLLFQLGVFH